jgi:hypothetical protein
MCLLSTLLLENLWDLLRGRRLSSPPPARGREIIIKKSRTRLFVKGSVKPLKRGFMSGIN